GSSVELSPVAGDLLRTSRLREGIRTDELNEKLGRLGVNVEIQESEDMGVLIIRGPQEDVDAVMQIIDTIEQLSAAAEPEIIVYRLKHISQSAAMSLLEDTGVQEAIMTDRPGRVSVLGIIRPNGFLLIGWGESLDRTIAFLDRIDQPEDPSVDRRVFHLRYAPVGTIYDLIEGYFADESGGLAATIRMVSDQRTNSLVVHASPRDMEVVAALVEDLDTNLTESVLKTKIFRLKNVLVEDLYSTLQQMITNSRGSTTSGSTSSSTRVSGGELEGQDGSTIRSGLLSDVRLATDQRLNLIIVSAPEDAMPLIEEMIRTLDSDDSISIAQIKIFPIQNAECQQIVTTLQTLLPSDLTSQGVKLAVAAEGEPSLIGLRFAVDSRTNSVIAIGSETDLNVVDALISRLDTEDVIERKTMVYPLRNQEAADVATAINEFLDAQQTLRQEEADAAGGDNPFSLLEEQVIVVAESERDLLIVSATPRYLDMIEQLVDRLDADIPEVMIQVLIAEVTLNAADEFGVEWGLQDSVLFDRSVASDGSLSPGLNFNSSSALGNSSTASNYSDVGGQALSAFGLGRTSAEAGFGGMVLSMSSESVSMLLRALAMQQRVEVQARPQIQTRNNKQAYILIGSRVARSSGQTVSLGTTQSNVNDVTVGTIIVVTPRIDDTDRVVIAVEAEKSQVGATADGTVIGYSDNGEAIMSPPINTIQAVTEVAAYDGQTTILGGLITRETTDGERKVPWLGDVPLVGNLFKYKYEYTRRSELMIILTPHIVKTSEDLARLKRIESSRMHWCLEDVREIHGNPRGLTSYGGSSEVVYPSLDEAISSEIPEGAVITGVRSAGGATATLPTPAQSRVPLAPPAGGETGTQSETGSETEQAVPAAGNGALELPPLKTTDAPTNASSVPDTRRGVTRTMNGRAIRETSEYRQPVTLESKANYEKHRVPTTVTVGEGDGPGLVEANGEETVVRVEIVDTPPK
ncbi:MAG: secretin N-terminal domain-containing protein, partial [Planctomycetia bacterium]|nr:secretin N-terminal domain-containing protein [Planctomycetia bacterium]